jgi:hypothetical protein
VRKKLYRTLTALLFAALVVCAVVIIRNTLDSRAGEQSYEMAVWLLRRRPGRPAVRAEPGARRSPTDRRRRRRTILPPWRA